MYQIFRIIIFSWLVSQSLLLSAKDNNLLVLGDSLSAAHGIKLDQDWVTLLEQRISEQHINLNIINASISGETTIGALTRLDNLISQYQPVIVIIELGGNDGLRGFSLQDIKKNLALLIEKIKQTNAEILLVPMQLPPNYGQIYNKKFQQVYISLADKYKVVLSRFILDDIAINPELMQEDGIHPVEEAQMTMLENIWPTLKEVIEEIILK